MTGPNNTTSEGLFIGTPGNVNLLVKRGDPVPALSNDTTIWSVGEPSLNDSGVVAFQATTVSPTRGQRSGIWAGTLGSLLPIVVQGNQAPGLSLGVTFTAIDAPLINSFSDVAFFATLSNNTRGVWLAPSLGAPELIAAVGLPLTIRPGDTRIVAEISPLTGTMGDNARSALSDTREVALNLAFTDNTRAVVVVTIPAPASYAGLLFLAGALTRRRRNTRCPLNDNPCRTRSPLPQ